MKIRIASYNVENLFERPAVMNLADWAEGKPTLDAYGKLNNLLQKPVYNMADKAKIVEILKALGLGKSDESKFVILRQNRGKLLRRTNGKITIVADRREDWIGWLELKWETVDETAIRMTGRVIRDVAAQIQGIVEVESRVALTGFNKQILGDGNGEFFAHSMVIDGNDERGIDVGMMTMDGFEIVSMRSHVDDKVDGQTVFSRDCAEYQIALPGTNKTLWVLMNHFKSKGFGSQADSSAKRKLQASQTRKIYEARKAAGAEFIVVMGDFNDTPDSDPLALLLTGSDLKDIQTLPASTMAAGPALSATARSPTRSISSCSRRHCRQRLKAAASSAKASGAAPTAHSSSTTRKSPGPHRRPRTTPPYSLTCSSSCGASIGSSGLCRVC
jgi:endonuclease/exonuclease/phosphatase family metal-dependent hydrolase